MNTTSTLPATNELTAIGVLASQLQRSVAAIRDTAATLGMSPAWLINQVPHYDREQVERLTAYFRENSPR